MFEKQIKSQRRSLIMVKINIALLMTAIYLMTSVPVIVYNRYLSNCLKTYLDTYFLNFTYIIPYVMLVY